jgi:RNA polymerase sigma-70 factor (ECF subfamily)
MSRLWDQEHDRHVLRSLLERIRPEFEPQTWEIFRIVVFEGRSPRDVRRDFGCSANAVHIAKARVLKRLRLEARGLIE